MTIKLKKLGSWSHHLEESFFWRVAQTTLEHDTKIVFLLNQGTEIVVVKQLALINLKQ